MKCLVNAFEKEELVQPMKENKIIIEKASIDDAKELLRVQKKAFLKYTLKYGDFKNNPVKMSLKRMVFNINYQFGQYYKITSDNLIIGGLFAFKYEDEETIQISQFYLDDEYQKQGIGSIALNFIFNQNPKIKTWYVDTIFEEKGNINFYEKHGFTIIDDGGYEPDHPGLTFVTMIKAS